MRLEGSNCNRRSNRSIAVEWSVSGAQGFQGKPTLWRSLRKHLLEWYLWVPWELLDNNLGLRATVRDNADGAIAMELTESAEIFLRVRSSGDPIIRMIWSNWSWLSLPLKRGTPEIISAKIQPQDQTSMEVLYVREPRRTSGARYHSVTTCRSLSPRKAVQFDSTYLIRESVDRHAERSCETKVSYLQLALFVDQQVLWFQITVEDSIFVAESCSLQKLIHEASHCCGIKGAAFAVGIHILLEISVTVLEDEDQLGLGVDNIIESDNVDVLQLLHQRDFTDRSRRGSFLGIEVNLLECNDLVGCPRATLGWGSMLGHGRSRSQRTL